MMHLHICIIMLLYLQNKFSPLMVASREGHYEIVKALLENKDKPDINAVNQIVRNTSSLACKFVSNNICFHFL